MLRLLIAVIVCANVATACGGDRGGVAVDLDEFSVTARPEQTEAGRVTFHVRNVGSVAHDFAILRTRRAPAALPVRKGQARTDIPGVRVVESIESLDPAAQQTVVARLGRGDYLLICNFPGHYASGMRTRFSTR